LTNCLKLGAGVCPTCGFFITKIRFFLTHLTCIMFMNIMV
jgi:hypothetical protein